MASGNRQSYFPHTVRPSLLLSLRKYDSGLRNEDRNMKFGTIIEYSVLICNTKFKKKKKSNLNIKMAAHYTVFMFVYYSSVIQLIKH